MFKKVFLFNLEKIKKKNLFIYQNIKFKIKRIYFHTNLKKGYQFGNHAHKNLKQIYICVSGSIRIKVIYDNKTKIFTLSKSSKGLYIGNNVWREIQTLTNNSALCTIADKIYNKNDYIRNFNEFKKNKIS